MRIIRLFVLAIVIMVSAVFGDAFATERGVKVGVVNNPPLVIVEPNGVPDGLAVEVINEVARRNGWQVTFVTDTWANLLSRLEAGEIDIQTAIAATERRTGNFDFNNESLISNWGVLYRHPDMPFDSVTGLTGTTVAVVAGATHTSAFRALMRNFGVTPVFIDVPTYEKAFEAVNAGAADFAVVSRLFGFQNARGFNVIETAMNFNPVDVKFAVPEGRNGDLLHHIDTYLASGKADRDSHFNQLLTKWLADPVTMGFPIWLTWVLLSAVALVLLLLAALWWQRRQVALQTHSLRLSQQKLVEAQCLARLGDFEWNMKTGAVTWSVGMYRLLGYDPDDGPRVDIDFVEAKVHHPEDAASVTAWLKAGMDNGQTTLQGRTYRLLRKDGNAIHVETNVRIAYSGGQPIRIFGTCHDISERMRVEEALLRAINKADTANKAKTRFLASMSHELRTPLNAILGFAQLMQIRKDQALTADQAEYIETIIAGGNHLLSLVNDILDLSQIESQEVRLNIEPVSVGAVILACVAQLSPLTTPGGVRIFNQAGKADDFFVNADKLRLKQVIINLLSNAIKYNKPGGSVTISANAVADGFVRIAVADTGIGIAARHFGDVFEAFNRLDADPMVSRDGAGIGLTVTRLLVERMGGRIDFESTEGVGSTFWIDLPQGAALTA